MPPKKEKKVQIKGDQEYLEQQYRPYSVNDIILNLHGSIAKSAAVKALENLTIEQKIVTKALGKMSISVAKKVEVEGTEKGIGYEEKLETIKGCIKMTTEKVNALETEITKYPSDEQLELEIESLQNDIQELLKRIESSRTKPSISPESVSTIKALSVSITSECQKRQRLYKNFLKYISEFIDPKELVTELGLEEMNSIANETQSINLF